MTTENYDELTEQLQSSLDSAQLVLTKWLSSTRRMVPRVLSNLGAEEHRSMFTTVTQLLDTMEADFTKTKGNMDLAVGYFEMLRQAGQSSP